MSAAESLAASPSESEPLASEATGKPEDDVDYTDMSKTEVSQQMKGNQSYYYWYAVQHVTSLAHGVTRAARPVSQAWRR